MIERLMIALAATLVWVVGMLHPGSVKELRPAPMAEPIVARIFEDGSFIMSDGEAYCHPLGYCGMDDDGVSTRFYDHEWVGLQLERMGWAR